MHYTLPLISIRIKRLCFFPRVAIIVNRGLRSNPTDDANGFHCPLKTQEDSTAVKEIDKPEGERHLHQGHQEVSGADRPGVEPGADVAADKPFGQLAETP